MLGSGGVVLLDNGIEAFSPKSNLKKQDGSFIIKDEKSEFIISEFNESDRKIIVSHFYIETKKDTNQDKEEPKVQSDNKIKEEKKSSNKKDKSKNDKQ